MPLAKETRGKGKGKGKSIAQTFKVLASIEFSWHGPTLPFSLFFFFTTYQKL
jgi:hypothetical protein